MLQIHDELVFEAPKSQADDVMAYAVKRMEKAMRLKVDLVADASWSENWIDAK